MIRIGRLLSCGAALCVLISPLSVFALNGENELVSEGLSSTEGDGASETPVVSLDGDKIAFASEATNLVADDTNGVADVFLRDRTSLTLERVSVSTAEVEADGASGSVSMSSDGRYVAFVSSATNLVLSDDNSAADCFLRDTETRTTVRVNLDENGNSADAACANPTVSDDGNLVVFESAATDLVDENLNGRVNVFLRNIGAGTTTLVSLRHNGQYADGDNTNPVISADGTVVLFESVAPSMTTDDDTGAVKDLFAFTLAESSLRLVSRAEGALGAKGNADSALPSIDASGRYVAFQSLATNLVATDLNGVGDCFLRDLTTNVISRINVDADGVESSGSCTHPVISSDAEYLSFLSDGNDLVAGDTNGVTDAFARPRERQDIFLISRGFGDTDSNAAAASPAISGEGDYVAWSSDASNLVATDTNGVSDVFLTENDVCLDSEKVSPGQCGCDVADTDTDSDGTADCLDSCDEDPLKTEPELCGCGVSEEDSNGSGAPDCLDPTEDTVPSRPTVSSTPKKNAKRVTMQSFASGRYTVQYQRIGESRFRTRTTRAANSVVLKNLTNGSYRVRYRVTVVGVTSRYSAFRRFKVR